MVAPQKYSRPCQVIISACFKSIHKSFNLHLKDVLDPSLISSVGLDKSTPGFADNAVPKYTTQEL